MKFDIYEIENIEDLLPSIEESLGIKFEDQELINLRTLGDLYEHIKSKIHLQKDNYCTNQQVFYKLRKSINEVYGISSDFIKPHQKLIELFPKKGRRQKVKELEQHFGIPLNLLTPPNWIVNLLLVALLGAIISSFFFWQIGLLGIFLSIYFMWLAFKFGKSFDFETTADLIKDLTCRNYFKLRKHSDSYNEDEIDGIISYLLKDALDEDRIDKRIRFA